MVYRPSDAFDIPEEFNNSLGDIFDEEPVSLDVFVEDFKFLNSPSLSPIQYELVQQIERVYLPELYPLMADEFGGYWKETEDIRMTNLVSAMWGKGGGKDMTVRVASLRVAYLLMCLKNPQRYYGMPSQDSIHLLNIAANAPQAHRAFFEPMTRVVRRGWFKDRADPKLNTIRYEKNIEAISGHSDAEGQEGLNLILGVADEIDAFKARNELVGGTGKRSREASTTAEGILNMLKTSASTRFPHTYKRVAISYPRYLGSTIMRLTAEAEADIDKYGEDSRYFASGPYATWEVNPLRKGKHEFESDYRSDPEEAAAKYECKPSRAINPYFRNFFAFQQAVDHETQPITITYEKRKMTSDVTQATTTGWEPVFHFAPWFKPVQGARYAMHGDLAINGDRAGIAMSHISHYEEREEYIVDDKDPEKRIVHTVAVPVVRNDFTIAFEADISEIPAREIQVRWARELAFELVRRGFPIVSYTFDQFQSADNMQILTQHGIESDRMSPDRDQSIWSNLRDIAYEARLRMCFSQLLMNEIESLSKIDGKVDHPPTGSKDLADAFACSVVGAIIAGGEEDPDGTMVELGESMFLIGDEIRLADQLGDLSPLGMDMVLTLPVGFERF